MQYRAQKNYDACKDRSLPVFGVGVAFIDEHVGYPKISNQIEKAIEEIKLIVSNLAPPTKELYIVPIERICCSDSMEGRDRLKELLDAVVDTTGKEDLLLHLRMLSLQKVGSRFDDFYLLACVKKKQNCSFVLFIFGRLP